MFEESSSSPQILDIRKNISKGGDFMREIDIPGTVNPDQARVDDKRKTPTHPLVRGRTRFDMALELVQADPTDQSKTDWSLFNSAREMDAVTDR